MRRPPPPSPLIAPSDRPLTLYKVTRPLLSLPPPPPPIMQSRMQGKERARCSPFAFVLAQPPERRYHGDHRHHPGRRRRKTSRSSCSSSRDSGLEGYQERSVYGEVIIRCEESVETRPRSRAFARFVREEYKAIFEHQHSQTPLLPRKIVRPGSGCFCAGK